MMWFQTVQMQIWIFKRKSATAFHLLIREADPLQNRLIFRKVLKIYIDKDILENIDIDINIDKEILENIDIDNKCLTRVRLDWKYSPVNKFKYKKSL